MANQQERQMVRYVASAKDLKIVWIDDTRYWRKPVDGDTPAELLQVCWLEVTGSVPVPDPSKKYLVTFEVSLTADAFGWNGTSLLIMCKKGGNRGNRAWKKVDIMRTRPDPESKFTIPTEGGLILDDTPATGDNTNDDKNIYFGLYEIWSGKWKGGLKIHKAIVEQWG